MKKFLITPVLLLILLLPAQVLAQEQPAPCQAEYTVQAGDWLSKIAEKYLGDALAFPQLVATANAASDDAYTNIDNPDVIEPGWTICVPPGGAPPADDAAMAGEPQAGDAMMAAGLAGTSWLLVSLGGQPALADTPVTADFGADGTLSGTAGCNNYSGSYTAAGDTLTVAPNMVSTMMACLDPIMQQESAFLAGLQAAATYQITGDSLVLLDANGTELMTFTANIPVELAGSSWRVIGYNNGQEAVVSVIIDTEMTATFGVDGQVTGSAGCNNYFAGYEVDGESISIGMPGATMMMCVEPEGIMEQEQQYLAALQTAATYRIDLDRLELRTADGALAANFELMPADSAATDMPAATAEEAAVTGTVTYLQRSALPDDAVVKVQLQDTSLADAPAMVMGEQLIPTNGQQVPIPFSVSYNPADIIDNHTYTLSVRIEDSSGTLLFINTTSVPVITRGNPTTDVEVIVDPV